MHGRSLKFLVAFWRCIGLRARQIAGANSGASRQTRAPPNPKGRKLPGLIARARRLRSDGAGRAQRDQVRIS